MAADDAPAREDVHEPEQPVVPDDEVAAAIVERFESAVFARSHGQPVVYVDRSVFAEVAGFLRGWRDSRYELKRSGYRALTQLIQAAWYDNTRAWPVIAYPGPPVLSG